MIITSKYAGACKVCSKAVHVGDRVSWVKGVYGVSHLACSAEGKEVAEQVAESRAVDVDTSITLPVPDGLSYLGYQRAGIAYALQRRSTLIADEMGLGKTIQAIGYTNANDEVRTVLVVCPASLKLNWRNEFLKWSTRNPAIAIVKTKTQWWITALEGGLSVDIVNYDILDKLPARDYDLIILDEAHYAKNPKAARTKAVQAVCKRAKHVLALTGTPILNKPIELWPILQVVDPNTWDPPGVVKGQASGLGEGAGFFRFAKRYCNAHQEWHGRTSHWEFSGSSNLPELQERLRTSCMVRRLKSDVLTELPPKRRQVVTVGNGCSDEEQWGDVGDDYETAYKSVSKIPFEDISRVRHEQALRKVPAAVEHIVAALESGSAKVVVFAHHKDVIEQLTMALGEYGAICLTGDTSISDRQEAVETFQGDERCRVFIGSIKAAGVGLTLTAASHVVFVELDWVPASLTQAEDRCHRIGQRESVLVQHLVLEGSLDAKMARLITEKQDVADMALDRQEEALDSREVVETREARRLRELAEAKITEADVSLIHTQLRTLAGMCDGAIELDGRGFNKIDSNFGKSLAALPTLTVRAAVAARAMLVKYRRQLNGN